jgi:hypothetical protein
MPFELRMKVEEETGLWVGAIGFFVALFGAALASTIFPSAGYWIGLSGVLLGFVGMLLHFMRNWREIFHIHNE